MNSLLLKSPLLQSSVLSPQYWPFSLEWIPKTAYLVGGCVRDALLEHTSAYLDLDFVLPHDPIQTAQVIARHYSAGFVVLDADRQIARVVFEGATADFALQVGETLFEDLARRDFTVNAIAYSPHSQTILDPLDGRADLAARTLRMVCAENLKDDPLRLLRAYRQAAQLDFRVDPDTRLQLYRLAPLLSGVAAERIRGELSYLLSHAKGSHWLKDLWQDGLLRSSFEDATEAGLTLIENIDQAQAEVIARWSALEALLHRTLSDRPKSSGEGIRRTVLATAKLVGLVSQAPHVAKQTLQNMKYSKVEINLVLITLQGLSQIQQDLLRGPLGRHQQYTLFRTVREAFPAVLVVAIAAGVPLADMAVLVDEYLNPNSVVAHPTPLVSGQTLMSALSLSSGPLVGQLLAALELAHAEARITTPGEAIEMARQLMDVGRLASWGANQGANGGANGGNFQRES